VKFDLLPEKDEADKKWKVTQDDAGEDGDYNPVRG
jgi:hypothetical protein